jgi:peptidoglycan hydrolase-like protein with peptidoglycan-binding domain
MAEPVLRKGSTDPAVRDLQEALKALGHDPGPIDGVFGATTEAAVKAFQQTKGITVDGIVGKVTWINIDEADQSEPVLKAQSRWSGLLPSPSRPKRSGSLTATRSGSAEPTIASSVLMPRRRGGRYASENRSLGYGRRVSCRR